MVQEWLGVSGEWFVGNGLGVVRESVRRGEVRECFGRGSKVRERSVDVEMFGRQVRRVEWYGLGGVRGLTGSGLSLTELTKRFGRGSGGGVGSLSVSVVRVRFGNGLGISCLGSGSGAEFSDWGRVRE